MNLSVFKWPNDNLVNIEACQWAAKEILSHPELVRLGYFGSCQQETIWIFQAV
jgi:hypothetical protein